MASFLMSEAYIVEKVISSGHADLDDFTCESAVCSNAHQAFCEAIKNMITCALDKNCDTEEEESLRYELVKIMRRRGVSAEKRYNMLKDVLISASRTFNAEKVFFNVKRTPIVAAEVVDEDKMVSDALQLLGASDDIPGSSKGKSVSRQPPRDPALRGCGRVLPPLRANEERVARMKRARFDNDFDFHSIAKAKRF